MIWSESEYTNRKSKFEMCSPMTDFAMEKYPQVLHRIHDLPDVSFMNRIIMKTYIL